MAIEPIVAIAPLLPPELQLWLEWGGSKLLAMQLSSGAPRQPHIAWPEYRQSFNTAYGSSAERMRPSRPSSKEIQAVDEILALPSLLPNPLVRRILHARALVAPISNRYLCSWTELGDRLDLDRRKVKQLHQRGIEDLTSCVPVSKIYTIRPVVRIFSLTS